MRLSLGLQAGVDVHHMHGWLACCSRLTEVVTVQASLCCLCQGAADVI